MPGNARNRLDVTPKSDTKTLETCYQSKVNFCLLRISRSLNHNKQIYQSTIPINNSNSNNAFPPRQPRISDLLHPHTFEGLLKFFLSNILVIGALVGALFLYGVYQQRNGRAVTQRPAGAKKIN
ncbi:hypothetical protein WAI453_009893 [Rhynchosporium graminicola]